MVCGIAQGMGQPIENPNLKFMAFLLNIKRRLNEQATMMQKQA